MQKLNNERRRSNVEGRRPSSPSSFDIRYSISVIPHAAPRLLLLVFITALAVVGPSHAGAGERIAVGSKAFPESRLLGELMALLIEENSALEVDRRFGFAGTLICMTAMRAGDIDLYAEYTGTGLVSILGQSPHEIRDPKQVFAHVKEEFEQKYNITWLDPFGFNNSYALAVRKDTGISKVSQLERHRKNLLAGFHNEFMIRPDGYPGLSAHYGFRLERVRGLEHGLAYIALRRKQIDVMDAYTTDGVLHKFDFVLLEDDKNFFPPYDAAPVVRQETLDSHPVLGELLGRLAGRIGQQKMVRLNYLVAVEGRSIEQVARGFLIDEGLIAASGPVAIPGPLRETLRLTLEHLYLTLIATTLSAGLGILLGLLVARHPHRLAGPVLGATGVIQTIPSLALLGFMIPLLGIGTLPAITALFLYGLLPIVRNTYTGITSVPADLKEAGRAMGMTPLQLLLRLEIPLATRTIMAGVRTALVINIGTATLAAFIGAGGLGEPITRGLQQGDPTQILWGAIPAACLALLIDWIMSCLERLVEPKGLRAAQKQ